MTDNLAHTLGLDSRFSALEILGQGAASYVLKVMDELHDAPRALKISTQKGRVRRFRHEYQLLKSFRHPNIVHAFDFGQTYHGMPYFTLELLPQTSLELFVGQDADPMLLAHLGVQVLDALGLVHARGVVHRDIKPNNILIHGSGSNASVTLIDFGLASFFGEPTSSGGTLPYIAPEVARRQTLGGRSDLFSLGMVFYELLLPKEKDTASGLPLTNRNRPFFEAATEPDIPTSLVTDPKTLPPVHHLNTKVPAALSAFVMRLMDADPNNRFANAGQAANALLDALKTRKHRQFVRGANERMLRGGAYSHRLSLVRTVRERARQVAKGGHGRMLLIEGQRGIGKTPFLREIAMRLNLDGMRVLRTKTTSRPGSPIPFLADLAKLPRTEKAKASHLWKTREDQTTYVSEVARFAGRLGSKLADFFGRVPTAVLFDDLHRADSVALDVLRALNREIAVAPIFLVCAAETPGAQKSLADLLGKQCERLWLGPLRRNEMARLIKNRLNGLVLPSPVLNRLWKDTKGMPRLVERTLAQLLLNGSIQHQAQTGRYAFVGGRYNVATYEQDRFAATHLGDLGKEELKVLQACAVWGRHFDTDMLTHMAELPLPSVSEHIGTLVKRGFVIQLGTSEHASYNLVSEDLATAVYKAIPVAVRQRLHDRAAMFVKHCPAQALQTLPDTKAKNLLLGKQRQASLRKANKDGQMVSSQGQSDKGWTENVWEELHHAHVLQGSSHPEAADAALRAAEHALTLFADRKAVDFFSKAYARLKIMQDPRRLSVALRLGQLWENLGHLDRSLTWYNTALSQSLPYASKDGASKKNSAKKQRKTKPTAAPKSSKQIQLSASHLDHVCVAAYLGIGRIAHVRGISDVAEQSARQALKWLKKTPDPRLWAMAERLRALVAAQAGDLLKARDILVEALPALQTSYLQDATQFYLDLAHLARERGELLQALQHAKQALRQARTQKDTAAIATACTMLGRGFFHAGRFRSARKALSEALRSAQAAGDRFRLGLVQRELGNVYLREADFDEALERYQASLDLVRTVRAPAEESAALHNMGIVQTRQGAFQRALVSLQAALNLMKGIGDVQGAATTQVELAQTYAQVGNCGKASDLLASAVRTANTLSDPLLHAEASAVLALVQLMQGRTDAGNRFLKQAEGLVATLEDPGSQALVFSCAARCAIRLKKVKEAKKYAHRLWQSIQQGKIGDMEAEARTLQGQVAILSGDKEGAQKLFHVAAALANRVGLKPLEAEVHASTGRLYAAGSDEALDHFTRAMEILRSISNGLSNDLVTRYLGADMQERIRADFMLTHQQIKQGALGG